MEDLREAWAKWNRENPIDQISFVEFEEEHQ